jgi:Xaa-Pro aminopeptidase
MAILRGGVGLIVAGEHHTSPDGSFRPHAHFEYLTGITDEPGAVLLLDPGNPDPSRREALFLAPLNPERERWDGYRPAIADALRQRVGITAIFRTETLPRMLTAATARSRRLCCLHPLSGYDQPVSPDLALFRRLAERVPGAVIEDRSDVLARLRAVKSRSEAALIQHAIDITASGYAALMRAVRPGMSELDVQALLEQAYRAGGARGAAFPTIAGAGINSTVLHYRANDQALREGDLICVDSGAAFGGYGADITRTLPVSGRFSDRQREVYRVVLAAQRAAIRAVRPGVTLAQIDGAARRVIRRAGLGDHFIHSTGHHLGLETHDASPDEPLRSGAVVTIEPGVYIPQEAIGIRIEDDLLVRRDGARVLSAKIPRTIADLEKAMAR